MKKVVVLISSILFLNICLSAQKNKIVTVRAGTKVLDYYPVQERYRYNEFKPGQIILKNGSINNMSLNYNFLLGEIEFIQLLDTLSIAKKKDIQRIVVAQDTFFFDKGYIEIISGGQVKMGLKQYVRLKDILKKGALGTTSRGSSVDSYNSLHTYGNFYELVPDEDIELQMTQEYYLATPSSGFVQFRKKSVLLLFPSKTTEIQKYLKSNKVNFDSREDLIRFTEYLNGLL
jgi:hypothetical protein